MARLLWTLKQQKDLNQSRFKSIIYLLFQTYRALSESDQISKHTITGHTFNTVNRSTFVSGTESLPNTVDFHQIYVQDFPSTTNYRTHDSPRAELETLTT